MSGIGCRRADRTLDRTMAAVGLQRCGRRGENNHRQVGIDPGRQPIGVPHPVEPVQPAAALEREVQHHQVRPPHLDPADPLPRARRSRHPKAVRGEVLDQEPARRLVLHHENQPLLVHTRKKDSERGSRPGRRALSRRESRLEGRDT
jgi:hypothetical protein